MDPKRSVRMEQNRSRATIGVITLAMVSLLAGASVSATLEDYAAPVYAEEDPFEEDPAARVYENSLISWSCVVDRQQWYRCLEKDYLHLKCFLLERFMHDVLFESSSSLLLRRFLELD